MGKLVRSGPFQRREYARQCLRCLTTPGGLGGGSARASRARMCRGQGHFGPVSADAMASLPMLAVASVLDVVLAIVVEDAVDVWVAAKLPAGHGESVGASSLWTSRTASIVMAAMMDARSTGGAAHQYIHQLCGTLFSIC